MELILTEKEKDKIKAIFQAIVIILKCAIGSRGKPRIFKLLRLQERAKIKQQIEMQRLEESRIACKMMLVFPNISFEQSVVMFEEGRKKGQSPEETLDEVLKELQQEGLVPEIKFRGEANKIH
jgi:hypothetical protein